MWILIVYMTIQGSVTFADYPTHQACEDAAAWLNGKPGVSAVCQYKGEDLALR